MKNKQVIAISLIFPVYNVSTVVEVVLESVKTQEYPIHEIIIIDNHSSDNSVALIKAFIKKNKEMPIKLIEREKTYGISSSYNLGAKLAKTEYIVSLHSDSLLPSPKEITKLMEPFLQDTAVIATFPLVVHTRETWLTYNFWQKCLFATAFGTESPSMNGKFDCYKKSVYLQIDGYDEKKFNHSLGTEDADMHHRLEQQGKVVATKARVIHLHGFEKNYSLKDWVARRKFLAVSYGRYVSMHTKDMKFNTIFFMLKPLLVLATIAGFIYPVFFLPILVFPFVYFQKMFTDRAVFGNVRIFALPFILNFLVFYETYWFFYSIFLKRK